MASNARGDGEPSFEQHLAALEKVVADLEGDSLSLEASIARYQEGVTRLGACRKILDAAEQRLAELVQAPDGTLSEKPLAVGPDGLVDPAAAPRSGPASAPAPRAERSAAARSKRESPAAATPADDDLPF
jgi:exodeoxyribonuclease VII small subunit